MQNRYMNSCRLPLADVQGLSLLRSYTFGVLMGFWRGGWGATDCSGFPEVPLCRNESRGKLLLAEWELNPQA